MPKPSDIRTPVVPPGPIANSIHRIKSWRTGVNVLATLLIFLLYMAVPLQAYVPHPLHMLDLMLGKPAKIKTATLEQRIIIHGYDSETSPRVHKGTLYFQWPKGYRAETVGEAIHRVHVVSGNDSLIIHDGFIDPAPGGGVDLYPDLLFFRTRSQMAQRLGLLDIDLATAGPGLWRNHPQWVLGINYPDSEKPQLWIDKENFRPLGLRINPSGNPDYPIWEIHYVNWQQKKGFRYPRRINFYQDEVLVREIEITAVKVNSKLAPGLLNVEKIRSQYPVSTEGQSPGQSMDEVDHVIEDFTRMYQP